MTEKHSISPDISVVMAVYNGEKYLAEAIESVLNQTFRNFEFIIVDDGSADHSREIIEAYSRKDDRIRLICRDDNKGVSASRNEGFSAAKGRWVAIFDADDICCPDRLLRQHDFVRRHPEVVAVGSAATFIDEEGDVICTYFPPEDDPVLRSQFPRSPFIHPSVMFSKDAFMKTGGYPEEMKWGGEDVVLFGRIMKFGLLHNLQEPLILYRLLPGSMSRKPAEFRSRLVDIIRDELAGCTVAEDRLFALRDSAEKRNDNDKSFDYHFEIAKLCIWSGCGRRKALRHLRCCWSQTGRRGSIVLMSLVTFFPKEVVRRIYFLVKGRRYGK